MILSTTTGKYGVEFGYKKAIEIIKNAGFDAYDMNMCGLASEDNNPLRADNYMEAVKDIKKTADGLGIICNQAHAPFPSQVYGANEYNEKMFNYTVRSMECAAYLGAKIIVVHPITEKRLIPGFREFENDDVKFRYNIDFYNRLLPYCKKYNIKVALENMWIRHYKNDSAIIPSVCGTADEFCRYLDALEQKWFVACLDVGHSELCDEEAAVAVRKLGKNRLKALHIHDNDCVRDRHAVPYTMNLDWDKLLCALGEIDYDGDFTFEVSGFPGSFPLPLIGDAASFLCKVGRYMVSEIERYRK